jgi:hypothetical protein
MRLSVVAMVAALLGCAAPAHRAIPQRIDELDATVDPPPGWILERSDDTARYVQRVWVSPTGRTSYGVIRFNLPLPLGKEIALEGFLAQMRESEGEARLIEKHRDRAQDRLIFAAEGGRYRLDGIIVTRGFHGWVVYSGVLRNSPLALDELESAVHARENTRLGLGDVQKSSIGRD